MTTYVEDMRNGVKPPPTTWRTRSNQKPPSVIKRIMSYTLERKKWMEAGKPVRSEELISHIFTTHCKECPHYTGTICNICGCMINTTTGMNKLYWATTNCPYDPPKWNQETQMPVAEEKQPELVEEEPIIEPEPPKPEPEPVEEIKKEGEPVIIADPPPEPVEIKPPPKKSGCGCGG